MSSTRYLFTRREFLRGALIAGAGLTLPAFLTRSVQSAAATPGVLNAFRDDRILVVIQLGGGNDGLNTVVPYANDAYYRARPALALRKERLIRLDDQLALNDRLEPLMRLLDDGKLAIVNGVGYPNPNRSHFRSMEIWHTAVDSDRYADTGWLGRYFDNCCAGQPDPLTGVNVGGENPQAFAGKRGAGVSFQQPRDFRWQEGRTGNDRASFDTLNRVGQRHDPDVGALDFLRHTTANAVISSDRVTRAGRTSRTPVDYPNSRLSNSLRTIATLIAGGLPTRIYYASMSGFDTHANQGGIHDNLLGQFAGALEAFLRDLKSIGVADRVQVMCFSEFGRRVGENASRGTDHGTAGPLFLAGAGITTGLHGSSPDLSNLDQGDLHHAIDFRAVYQDVLEKWMGAKSETVLGRRWKSPGVVSA